MEYILHIGMTKTGSTSLQRALSDNRETLRQHGVIYPMTAIGHDRFKYKHAGLRKALLCNKYPNFVGMLTDWAERLRSETAGADICVFSDEELSQLLGRDSDLEAITTLIPRERTQVVMYIREPVAHTVSIYQQRMKSRIWTKSLRDFVGSCRLPILRSAERWSSVFGRGNMIIRQYGRDCGRWDIVSDFADVIGLKPEDAFPGLEDHEQKLNPGMAGNLLFVKRMLNHFITFKENRTIRGEIEKLKWLDESFRGKIPVDQETVNMISNRFREEFEGIDRLYGLSIVPRDKPVDATPCPDLGKLAHDFALIRAWAHESKGKMAPLLERAAGMFATDGTGRSQ